MSDGDQKWRARLEHFAGGGLFVGNLQHDVSKALAENARLRAAEPKWSKDWEAECLKWRGEVLKGTFCHYCSDFDELPVDETCHEWPCRCVRESLKVREDGICPYPVCGRPVNHDDGEA